MATRGCIGRKTPGGFIGVYHHWDAHPDSLGKALYQHYHGHFKKDMSKMLQYIIDQHPAGWSNLVGADLSLPAGFQERPTSDLTVIYPECYCHGFRHEEPRIITSFGAASHCGAEYCYIIDEQVSSMTIYERSTGLWTFLEEVDLNGDEPLWVLLTFAEED